MGPNAIRVPIGLAKLMSHVSNSLNRDRRQANGEKEHRSVKIARIYLIYTKQRLKLGYLSESPMLAHGLHHVRT